MGAVVADFNGDGTPFFGYIKRVDANIGNTIIAFENSKLPDLTVPKTYGGVVSSLRLDGFNRDLLLLEAKLKDPVFTKYYLYVLKNNRWKPVMNGFAIHQDNQKDVAVPIWNDTLNPSNLMRHYSVFDLDKSSELGYTWRLLQESVPIKNR